MTKKTSSDNSGSTHSSYDSRRSKVATSMRKFLEEEDDFDYLGSITSSRSITNSSKKSTTPTSYRKKDRGRTSFRNSSHSQRPTIPKASKPKSTKPKSIRKKSNDDAYEGGLNDAKSEESAKGLMSSARKLLDKAARAASPGRLRKDKSPGPQKIRDNVEERRSGSPTTNNNSDNTEQLTASPPTPSKKKGRSKSPGRMKSKRDSMRDGSEHTHSTSRSTKRSQSPGKYRKRSESPGKHKGRSSRSTRTRSESPGKFKNTGALRKTNRPRRKPENRGDGKDTAPRSVRRARSSSNGPMKKTERDKSRPRSRRAVRSKENLEGEKGLKVEQSYSDMQGELNKYKVKRNKSMDMVSTIKARRAAAEATSSDDDDMKKAPRRANSMMLQRDMGRRGKSNSLGNLVQYSEEEIHSTSYFASNHVLVNRERMKRGLRPLCRNIAMDDLARKSAEKMAESNGKESIPTTYVGNVLRGETIRSIHRSTMLQKAGRERTNILNPYFQDFGVGTCKGADGTLYMCQLFSERLELALTDTMQEKGDDHSA